MIINKLQNIKFIFNKIKEDTSFDLFYVTIFNLTQCLKKKEKLFKLVS